MCWTDRGKEAFLVAFRAALLSRKELLCDCGQGIIVKDLRLGCLEPHMTQCPICSQQREPGILEALLELTRFPELLPL